MVYPQDYGNIIHQFHGQIQTPHDDGTLEVWIVSLLNFLCCILTKTVRDPSAIWSRRWYYALQRAPPHIRHESGARHRSRERYSPED